MSHRFASLLLCLAAVFAIGRRAPAQVEQPRPPVVSVDPVQTTPAAPTTLRVRGTIDEYDVKTGVLSLSTSSGVVRFPVAASARIRRGAQKLDASALSALSGHRAAVRYSELAGTRTVESVNVFEQGERIVR